MANENLQKLEELLRSDEQAQAKLQAAIDAFEGDKADEQAFFEATVGKVGEELDLPISFEDAKAYAKQLAEVDEAKLDAVAGGGGYCFIIGIHDDVETDACACSDENGADACAYVGVGIFYS